MEIVEFKIQTTKLRIGYVLIRYEKLMLRTELVYNKKDNKLWIRMPEVWLTPDIKKKFAYWESKEDSDAFQKEILQKLLDDYDVTVDKMKEVLFQFYAKFKTNPKPKIKPALQKREPATR